MISETDQKVYDCIVKYKRENDGVAPAMREICTFTGIASTSQVKASLANLANDNLIELIPGKAGGIKVIGGKWSLASEQRPAYQPEPIRWVDET